MNLCIFIGNLGADPEVRYTPSGAAVANVNLAVNERWKDREGQQQEKTEWIPLVAWNKTAELMGTHLRKGSKVGIQGRWQTRSWVSDDGQKHYKTECVVDKMSFLDGRRQDGGGSSGGDASREAQARNAEAARNASPLDDDDSCLPF